jgi:hypothetical protein
MKCLKSRENVLPTRKKLLIWLSVQQAMADYMISHTDGAEH